MLAYIPKTIRRFNISLAKKDLLIMLNEAAYDLTASVLNKC